MLDCVGNSYVQSAIRLKIFKTKSDLKIGFYIFPAALLSLRVAPPAIQRIFDIKIIKN